MSRSKITAHYTQRAGHNVGFRGVVGVCIAVALLGIFCMVRGLGIPVGCFLIVLSGVSFGVAYLLDRRSVRDKKSKYDRNILAGYQRLHCRDQRTFEADQTGMHFSCRCGNVTRPWSELTQFSENKSLFLIATRTDKQIVPKSGFPSEGEITEFRKLFLEKLDHDQPLGYWAIDFAYTKPDFRNAYFLHILKGGGWRPLSKRLATFAVMAYGILVIWNYMSPNRDPAPLCGLIGAFVAFPLLKLMRRRRRHYFGSLRICFGDNGLQLQHPGTLARFSWNQFIGFLENRHVLLLYGNPRTYTIIPKRALAGREAQLRVLLDAKLAPYNYRNPALAPRPELSGQPTS